MELLVLTADKQWSLQTLHVRYLEELLSAARKKDSLLIEFIQFIIN
jgi:hypothetical protein